MTCERPTHMIAVLVILERDGSVLLVKPGPGESYWSLPGGVVEAGESLEEAAIREVMEETCLEVSLSRLVGVYSKRDQDALAVTFEGVVTGGTLSPSHEIVACSYFPTDDLPAPSRPHLRGRLADWAAQHPGAVFRTD